MSTKTKRGALRPTSEIKSARILESAQDALALIERDARPDLALDDDGKLRVRTQSGSLSAKAMPAEFQHTAEQARALAAERGVPWREEYAGRLMHYWASDERVDGHGDIVRQDWRFELFKDNPAMPFSHRWEDPTIGTHLDWKVLKRTEGDYSGPSLALLSLFATAEQSAFADSIFRLVSARMLRAGSVGFAPGRVVWVEDKAERAELGLGNYGYILEDNELLEFSPTTLGANPGAGVMNALAKAKRAGLVRPVEFLALREIKRQEIAKADRDAWKDADAELVRIGRLLFPGERMEAHEDLDAPIALGEEPAKSWHAEALAFPVALLAGDAPEAKADAEAEPQAETAPEPSPEPEAKADEPAAPSIEERLAALDAKLESLLDAQAEAKAAMEEFLLGVQRQLDEQREQLEDMHARLELTGVESHTSDVSGAESESAAPDALAIGRALRQLAGAR